MGSGERAGAGLRTSNTAGDPIDVGDGPLGIAITPDGTTAHVTKSFTGDLTPINVATGTPEEPTAGTNPVAVAITPDQAPRARGTVNTAPAGTATTFDASTSTVTYGSIATYAWDFGDGTTQTTTTPTTSHTYTTAGYTATSTGGTSTRQIFTGQTMSRNGGPSAVATATITVPAASTTTTTDDRKSIVTVPRSGRLARTGSEGAPLIRAGLALVTLGTVAILVTRRRRRRSPA